MTGMDVLRRVRSYEKDMARLRLQLACVRDAAMRITRSTDTTGHGGQEDKMGEYAARADAIEREMAARTTQHNGDLLRAGMMVAQLDPEQGVVMYMRMVRGLTFRQTAGELKISESSVKGLYRRGREALEGIVVEGYA